MVPKRIQTTKGNEQCQLSGVTVAAKKLLRTKTLRVSTLLNVQTATSNSQQALERTIFPIIVKVRTGQEDRLMVNNANRAYVSSLPDCDFCQSRKAEIDAATKEGPWAFMCGPCAGEHSLGQLGAGLGQHLIATSNEEKLRNEHWTD